MKAKLFAISVLLLTLIGCASPQPLVALNNDIIRNTDNRIGVAMNAFPEAGLRLPGADCLLCLAVAFGANSELNTHAKTLPTDDLDDLKNAVGDVLESQGKNVVVIEDDLDIDKLAKTKSLGEGFSKKDFSEFADKYHIDHMIVIDIDFIGLTRPYSSYIPTGQPQATVHGRVSMVNLETNKFNWYLPIASYLSADGEWDEPTEFPNLTNAYYQVIENIRDMLLAPLDEAEVNPHWGE
tara:strand:- start:1233 stop:1946 length:714 start_codon:yes stop_codon:yes gene_type:complete